MAKMGLVNYLQSVNLFGIIEVALTVMSVMLPQKRIIESEHWDCQELIRKYKVWGILAI